MVKSNKSGLTPVQKQVTRQGKTFTQTFYVKTDKYTKQGKSKPVETKTQEKSKNSKQTKFDVNKFNSLKSNKSQALNYLKECGVTWKENKHEGINWMYAMMEVKKLNSGYSLDESKKETKKEPDELRKQVNTHIDSLIEKHGKNKMMSMFKEQGITWKEDEHEGINWMRFRMKLREHMEKTINNSVPEIKKEFKQEKPHKKYKYSDITDSDWEEWAVDPETFKDVLSGKPPKVGQMTGSGSKLTEKEKDAIIEGAYKIQSVAENTRNKSITGVFRGESYNTKQEVYNKYKPGSEIQLETLTSTGITRDIAREYASSDSSKPVKVLITIRDNKGIKGVRTAPYGEPSGEIILPKGDNYRVLNVSESKNGEILVMLSKEYLKPKNPSKSEPENKSKNLTWKGTSIPCLKKDGSIKNVSGSSYNGLGVAKVDDMYHIIHINSGVSIGSYSKRYQARAFVEQASDVVDFSNIPDFNNVGKEELQKLRDKYSDILYNPEDYKPKSKEDTQKDKIVGETGGWVYQDYNTTKGDGSKAVRRGLVKDGWAIEHRDDAYKITHVNSGILMLSAKNISSAKKAVKELSEKFKENYDKNKMFEIGKENMEYLKDLQIKYS